MVRRQTLQVSLSAAMFVLAGAMSVADARAEGEAMPTEMTPPVDEALEPAPVAVPVETTAPVESTVAVEAVGPAVGGAPAEEKSWYDNLSVAAWVDSYVNVDYNFPRNQNSNPIRAFDFAQGFAIHWAALDVSYETEHVGATISLRFGPGVEKYGRGSTIGTIETGIAKQAFVTWKATGKLTIDFGKFDTIYGAEVADTQLNWNYGVGALFNTVQPFFHTGFRVNYAFDDQFYANFLLVNGYDSVLDNNVGKSVGLQFGYAADKGSLVLGGIFGPEAADVDAAGNRIEGANSNWRYLIDVIGTINLTDALAVKVNGDFRMEDLGNDQTDMRVGGLLAVRYAFTEMFATAVRGEFIHYDNDTLVLEDGGTDYRVITGTLTLEFVPVEHLIIKLEGRMDASDGNDLFQSGPTPGTDFKNTAFSTVLGVVVHS
jgi:hypothetical protein